MVSRPSTNSETIAGVDGEAHGWSEDHKFVHFKPDDSDFIVRMFASGCDYLAVDPEDLEPSL